MGRVSGTPHDPGRGTGEGTGEGEHLNTGVAPERGDGDDTVLDGRGGSGTDEAGTEHLEDRTEDHGLSVRDGSGGDRGGPRVGNIVCGLALAFVAGGAALYSLAPLL